ncbi:hypothetical protein RJ641_027265 [Dillenia turbinata]|uniref:Uncharacterized protein n=1 Tax=Dillenia turbinata TaxID=194707 RepID=A0AAN8VVW4_9MAGN
MLKNSNLEKAHLREMGGPEIATPAPRNWRFIDVSAAGSSAHLEHNKSTTGTGCYRCERGRELLLRKYIRINVQVNVKGRTLNSFSSSLEGNAWPLGLEKIEK